MLSGAPYHSYCPPRPAAQASAQTRQTTLVSQLTHAYPCAQAVYWHVILAKLLGYKAPHTCSAAYIVQHRGTVGSKTADAIFMHCSRIPAPWCTAGGSLYCVDILVWSVAESGWLPGQQYISKRFSSKAAGQRKLAWQQLHSPAVLQLPDSCYRSNEQAVFAQGICTHYRQQTAMLPI